MVVRFGDVLKYLPWPHSKARDDVATSPRQSQFHQHRHILRKTFWSGRRGSNPRPSRWQRDALPLSYTRIRRIAAHLERRNRQARLMAQTRSRCKGLQSRIRRRPSARRARPRPWLAYGALTGAARSRKARPALRRTPSLPLQCASLKRRRFGRSRPRQWRASPTASRCCSSREKQPQSCRRI